MGVNEHERLSNFTLRHKSKYVNELHFYWCSRYVFKNHSRVFNTEYNSYPKMSVKWPPELNDTLYNTIPF
jgi:hypothetical protein